MPLFSDSPYRAIALDLDGTVLDSRHRMPPGVRDTLRAASDRGYRVVLVSARLPRSVRQFVDAIGVQEPYVALNGALLVQYRPLDGVSVDEDIVYRAPIQADDVRTVIDAARARSLVANVYADYGWYVETADEWVRAEAEIIGFGPDVGPIDGAVQSRTEKILVMGNAPAVRRLHDDIAPLGLGIRLTWSMPEYLEIVRAGVDKGTGAARLCEYLGIAREQLIAVGDNFNDVEMLQFAGLGVAVGNAPDAVKAIAGRVIPTNDEQGVAHFVREILLGRGDR
jgi:Cof subfamily protein (haloacid dehalogenase superfamily)